MGKERSERFWCLVVGDSRFASQLQEAGSRLASLVSAFGVDFSLVYYRWREANFAIDLQSALPEVLCECVSTC